tara:strand:- start:342 stop:650 length:309 start_codon:yes stop_codon:yes gene_type:complete
MAININSPVETNIRGIGGAPAPKTSDAASGKAFEEALNKAGAMLVEPHAEANRAIQNFTNGGTGNLHETMLTVEKEVISFKYMMTMRNKLLQAYQEIMRMGM